MEVVAPKVTVAEFDGAQPRTPSSDMGMPLCIPLDSLNSSLLAYSQSYDFRDFFTHTSSASGSPSVGGTPTAAKAAVDRVVEAC